MGEVHEVEQTENDGQAHGNQKVDHPQAKAVEQLEQVKTEHARTLCSTRDGCIAVV
ncbi:hypothetical protein D3C81_1909550 [compost metagenome]